MKKVVLLFFTLLVATSGFSQGVMSMFARTDEFFTLMEEQKYDTAHNYFDVSVQTKITPANLKDIWADLHSRIGNLSAIDVVQSKTQGEVFIVTVDLTFERGEQGFVVIFNKTEKIVGLIPRQKENLPVYALPAYADTTLYNEKEIYIKTPGHSLVGVLTTPKKGTNFPIVVLVHGSGSGDMDESRGPNKPFKDLATGLASKGIASIRYVKRTLVYAAEKYPTVKEEVLDDAVAAIDLARNTPGVDKKQIYMLGHSLGGMLAPRIAGLAPDLNGIIMLSTPARKLPDLLDEQNKYFAGLSRDTTGIVKTQLEEALKESVKARLTKLGDIKPDSIILGMPASYWLDLNLYDQVGSAKKLLKQRIFMAQGADDIYVNQADYNDWNIAIGKKPNTVLKKYPMLNHILATKISDNVENEYQNPSNMSVTVINDIANWIKLK